MYGGADVNAVVNKEELYYAVTDDDFTKMTGMYYCVQDGFFGLVPAENFRGFRPDIYSPVSGTSTFDFGVVSGIN